MKRWLASGLLLVTPACASMQKERGHEDVARIVEQRTGYRTGWERGSPEDRQIADRVSKLLSGGLTRNRAIELALINNPRLQETYEELDVSQADLVQAGLLSNPTLSGSVGFPIGNIGRSEYEVSLVQSFLDIFMLPLRKRFAEKQFIAETLRVAHAALEVAAEVSKEFAELQAAEQTVAMMGAISDGAGAAAQLADEQFEAGNITERTVTSERAVAEQIRLELARDQLGLLEHREKLNRLLGLWGPRTAWNIAEKLPEIPAADAAVEHLERTALQQRLDVAAARKQVEVMDSALSLAKTSRYTGVVDVGIHTHQDPDGARLLGPTLSLELPIFDQRQALIGRLAAQRRQAQRHLDALAIDARSEVRLAAAKLELSRRTAQQYQRALLPMRKTMLEQAQLEYNAMQIGLYELLAAKQAETETLRAYIEAVRDYWVARAELERALGGKIPGSREIPAPEAAAPVPPATSGTPAPHQHGAP